VDDSEELEKLAHIDIGDSLPTLTLKNEKGEDVDVATLASEKGVIFFLVPKADTREFEYLPDSSGTHLYDYQLLLVKLQRGALPKRAVSGIFTLTSRP